ncbi:response regulator [Euzebya tangerina]|uniref:response regulator n=1 Tax=Euzebya tangerina TaxID=591198 RepID=UPI00196ABCE7|nr:response regulator transcription factor [Euzebya tangerina]
MSDLIEVVLVDDQQLVRSGFRMILEAEPDITITGEAENGEAGLDLIRRVNPHVVLLDIEMPRMDGIEVTAALGALPEPPRVVVLTTFERDDYVFRALRNGASGFLLKSSPPEQLVEAVRVVAAGESLLAPSVTRRMIEAFASGEGTPPTPDPALDRLTDREREVLALMAQGLSNTEIAERLVVGEATVKTHVSNTLTKLGVRDRVQAVVWAFTNGAT